MGFVETRGMPTKAWDYGSGYAQLPRVRITVSGPVVPWLSRHRAQIRDRRPFETGTATLEVVGRDLRGSESSVTFLILDVHGSSVDALATAVVALSQLPDVELLDRANVRVEYLR